MTLPYWVYFGCGYAVRVNAYNTHDAILIAMYKSYEDKPDRNFKGDMYHNVVSVELDYERC